MDKDKPDLMLNVGDIVQATRGYTWTLDEFEDFPLIVNAGDLGTVQEVDSKEKKLVILWENENFPDLKRALSFEEAADLQKIQKSLKER